MKPPPTPPRSRAEAQAAWAERDARSTFTRAADIWSATDPRDGTACAFERWQALVDAGLMARAPPKGPG